MRVSLNLLIFVLLREREREIWYKFLLLGFFFWRWRDGGHGRCLSTGSEEVVSTSSCV